MPSTYDLRRLRLRDALYHLIVNEDLSHDEAVQRIAKLTGRKRWTVLAWISERENKATIPNDTLILLELRLGLRSDYG